MNLDLNLLAGQVQNLIAQNARVAQDQTEYKQKYTALVSRYEAAKKKYDQVVADINRRTAKGREIDLFISNLQDQALIQKFNKRLWCSLVDYLMVQKGGAVTVTFKDGTEIKA